jgi:Ca2+-binding EF-hand superfamily protein
MPRREAGGVQLQEARVSLDQDSDGRISKTEAAADTNVTEQFSRYDQNGNGFIERDEVSNANNSPPPAQQ